MRWIYELIVEKIPPFSLLPKVYVTTVQLLLMEFVGITIALIFELPPNRAIKYGSIIIFVVVLWSVLTLYIAPTIRSFRPSLSEEENRVIETYKRILFHPKHLEVVPGLVIFFIFLYYFFVINPNLLIYYLGKNHQGVLVFAAILLWDVSYRAGLGVWVTYNSLVRSILLLKISRRRKKLEHTLLYDLRSMERMDLNNLVFGLISLIIYPVFQVDLFISVSIIVYVCMLLIFSSLSIYFIRKVPWLPPDIMDLLNEGKFAYVGTVESIRPHVTPVVYVFDGRYVYFATSTVSKKYKNIKKVRKIAILIDERDPTDLFKNKAVLIKGRAAVLGISSLLYALPTLIRVRNLFHRKFQKYMGVYKRDKSKLPKAWQLTPMVRRIPVKIIPEEVIYWRGARKIRIPL